jgi:leucyl-tRNA synthetase
MKSKTKSTEYNHQKIEKKWQKIWKLMRVYKTSEKGKKPKCYVLDMFPYPSGTGLHVGHPRGYIASDVYARLKRMKGFNVLHPMGYDAFGLPAEQYAIAHKIHPRKAVEENIKTYRKQLDLIGFSYDWSRSVNTSDPEYYKWTQWIFLKLYSSWYNKIIEKAEPIENLIKIFEKEGNENINAACSSDARKFTAEEWKIAGNLDRQNILMQYRLAYQGFSEVNWCPQMGTVLANDEITTDANGKQVSERGGYPVEKKTLRQWFLRITAYADRLIEGLDDLIWSPHIKEIQKNWIGKSIGSDIEFSIKGRQEKIKVFTTRADTLFGVTYVVLAPECDLVKKLLPAVSNRKEVEKYIADVKSKTDEDRMSANKDKTGVILEGIKAINPANLEEVPVFVADYVLANYGTGMVMAVPAHDERDYAFAKKYNLPIKEVIAPYFIGTNDDAPRKNIETLNRDVIDVVIENENGEFLLMREKNNGVVHIHFVGGGTDGEDEKTALKREIIEETGYTEFDIKNKICSGIYSSAFRHTKNKNQYTFGPGYHVKLKSLKKIRSEVEDGKHELLWVKKDKVKNLITWPGHLYIWNNFLNPNTCFINNGKLINSGKFDGMDNLEAIRKITAFVFGKVVTRYKMRDAVFARQRYWGEPIPLIHNKNGTITPLNEKDLPLKLPNVSSYEPIGTGESPLAGVKEWVKKGYETNTMPGWAGSSWYFLRYMDPHNQTKFVGEKADKYWKQVDMYVGGAEHATGHLLYSRFWNKFLFDYGFIVDDEPFKCYKNLGMILGSDSRKMSKRWGNVINPDDVVKNVGADTLRIYESFMGPFDQEISWSTDSMIGSRRFLERVWKLQEKVVNKYSDNEEVILLLNQTIKKVGEDIESFSANTAISSMMILSNLLEQQEKISKKTYLDFIKILSPFAPHICEEIWFRFRNRKLLVLEKWPKYDTAKLYSSKAKIVVQINGKFRTTIEVPADSLQDAVEEEALKNEQVVKWILVQKINKIIFIKNRIINFVIASQ